MNFERTNHYKARHSEVLLLYKNMSAKTEGIPTLKDDCVCYSLFNLHLWKKGGSAYIMTNKRHSVLYTGVTEDLERRVLEQRKRKTPRALRRGINATF